MVLVIFQEQDRTLTHVVAFCLPSFLIRLELFHLLEASFHLLPGISDSEFRAILDLVLLAALCSVWVY